MSLEPGYLVEEWLVERRWKRPPLPSERQGRAPLKLVLKDRWPNDQRSVHIFLRLGGVATQVRVITNKYVGMVGIDYGPVKDTYELDLCDPEFFNILEKLIVGTLGEGSRYLV